MKTGMNLVLALAVLSRVNVDLVCHHNNAHHGY
jgi:hypothetical protein